MCFFALRFWQKKHCITVVIFTLFVSWAFYTEKTRFCISKLEISLLLFNHWSKSSGRIFQDKIILSQFANSSMAEAKKCFKVNMNLRWSINGEFLLMSVEIMPRSIERRKKSFLNNWNHKKHFVSLAHQTVRLIFHFNDSS